MEFLSFQKINNNLKNKYFDAFITVVLAFLSRYRPISVAVPSPYRRRPYGTPLPQRDSPF